MHVPAETIDRISPTRRPDRRIAGYQQWSNLLFLHWRVPAEQIRPLIPEGLTLDLWEGDAWIGLVPFFMSGVRPWWCPALPGVSRFCETNVRTYVHYQDANPGVLFLSLEAARALPVAIARWRWHLPYFHARMELDRSGDWIRYASLRRRSVTGAGCRIAATIGPDWTDPQASHDHLPLTTRPGTTQPGTLEHFLVERYLLYAQGRNGTLLRGQVHHRPYPLRSVTVHSVEVSLLSVLGIPCTGAPHHAIFSEGVSVEIFPLLPVT